MNSSDSTPRGNEFDPRFPNSPCFGFFQQDNARCRQRMNLRFSAGRISGSGSDPCSRFTIAGTSDTASGLVRVTKSYFTHQVSYDGTAEHGGDGIPGTWSIRAVRVRSPIPGFSTFGKTSWPCRTLSRCRRKNRYLSRFWRSKLTASQGGVNTTTRLWLDILCYCEPNHNGRDVTGAER